MKAARLHEYGDVRLHLDEAPDPQIQGPHDVIVRIGGAGVCRTDPHVMEGIWHGIQDPRPRHTLGHENAGWVEEVGPSVTTPRPGDAVLVHPLVTDGVRPACRSGEDVHCEHAELPGLNVDGGFARYLKTVERSALKGGGRHRHVRLSRRPDPRADRALHAAAQGLSAGTRSLPTASRRQPEPVRRPEAQFIGGTMAFSDAREDRGGKPSRVNALPHWPSAREGFCESRRVLRPEARVVIVLRKRRRSGGVDPQEHELGRETLVTILAATPQSIQAQRACRWSPRDRRVSLAR